jgi:hypothetical protein
MQRALRKARGHHYPQIIVPLLIAASATSTNTRAYVSASLVNPLFIQFGLPPGHSGIQGWIPPTPSLNRLLQKLFSSSAT